MNGNTTKTISNHAYLMVHGEYLKFVVKIRKDILFQHLIDTYCNKTGIKKDSVKFLCDGRLLRGDKSISSLGLEDNDVIETYISQTDNPLNHVKVKVFGLENIMVEMSVEKQAALENLMFAYSNFLNICKNSVVFKLGNKMIRGEDTPSSIGLKDGDLIKVLRQLKRKPRAEHSTEPPSDQTRMSTMHVPAAKRR